MQKRYTIPVIIGGALVITALGIDAADTVNGSRATLLASIFTSSAPALVCATGMVPVWLEVGMVCVDTYEASVGDTCVHRQPTSVEYTQDNISDVDCVPVSTEAELPWRFVTRTQAEQLCARAGKQLITSAVWYQAALGTNESGCNTEGVLAPGGVFPQCHSGVGTRDMVGNVWEWIQGDINSGQFEGNKLPQSGYVTLVNSAGIAIETMPVGTTTYGFDYSWGAATGTMAMMRGGFYGGKSDTGLYSTHTGIRSDFASAAVGFRCMQSQL